MSGVGQKDQGVISAPAVGEARGGKGLRGAKGEDDFFVLLVEQEEEQMTHRTDMAKAAG